MEKNLKTNEHSSQTPVVSIIMPTYNRAGMIGQAIDSVLGQSFSNWELLILDDSSTDGTEALVNGYTFKDKRIKYVQQKSNVGIAKNRNTGLELAKGKYIAMLDSDDIWLDTKKLEQQVNFLESHPKHALVGTQVVSIDSNSKEIGKFKYETHDSIIRKKFLSRNQFTQSSVLYRLSAARAVGNYDPKIIVNDDYGLWLALGTKYKFANLSEYMTGYRIHSGGITKTRRLLSAQEHLILIRKYRKNYPGYFPALLKAVIRIIKAHI